MGMQGRSAPESGNISARSYVQSYRCDVFRQGRTHPLLEGKVVIFAGGAASMDGPSIRLANWSTSR